MLFPEPGLFTRVLLDAQVGEWINTLTPVGGGKGENAFTFHNKYHTHAINYMLETLIVSL